ncbi:MAG: TRAP transporter fused permease subunit [Desulfobacterales bacterium]|nr:TRAP transporter fused permease subunit [Desulfobacterales bacterium]
MTWFKEKLLEPMIVVIGVLMVLYHMVSSQYLFLGAYEHQAVHLIFVLLLTFLTSIRKSHHFFTTILNVVFIVLGLVATLYVLFNMRHLEEAIGYPEPMDVVIGVILIFLAIEGTRQTWGLALPIVASFFVLYFFLGHLLPGPLGHRQFNFTYIISYLSIGLSGIFGTFLSISANQVFLFVVFGAVLGAFKVNDLFYELGKIAGRLLQGGPAHTAVISSSLVGMVSGAPVANVAITGAFTIPYMKRIGYTPEQAAAIEATASTGGQLMPPVMGAAAFLMATFLGEPYAVVMLAGILPAILFYLSVGAGVQFMAASMGLVSPTEKVNKKLIAMRFPIFLIPLAVMFLLLLMRYSPMLAGFWAIIAVICAGVVNPETRPGLKKLLMQMAQGATVGAKIGISLALVGIMAQSLITTGLGSKIAGLVQTISGGNILIALAITMVVSIILGCGVPPAAAYSLVAIVVIPSLVRMGVVPLSAHFFSFYFAIISAITPPVALAALAGSGIAKANYGRTGIKAFKLAISGFILPYLFVFNPVFSLNFEDTFWAVGSFIALPVCLVTFTAVIYNYGLAAFSWFDRLIAFLASILLFAYTFMGPTKGFLAGYTAFLGGMGFFILVLARQIKARKRAIANAINQGNPYRPTESSPDRKPRPA